MSFFEDLTPYTYFPTNEEKVETVNIGWLDWQHKFSTGKTSAAFRKKLRAIGEKCVNQTRGFHSCEFCKGRDKPHGSAEIRVVGVGRVYAAPELIYHYVVAHNYKPPDEFVAAVLNSDVGERE